MKLTKNYLRSKLHTSTLSEIFEVSSFYDNNQNEGIDNIEEEFEPSEDHYNLMNKIFLK